MDDQPTYEVVGYDDARAIAEDAAAMALEREGVTQDSELGAVAESAATSAVDAASGAILDEIDQRVDGAAEDAAASAVSQVHDEITAALDRIELRAAEVEDATIELDGTQYDAMMLELRALAGAQFLTLCLVAALFGALLWSTVAREFR